MKLAAIVQTRMSSTRLPGKVLMETSGKTLLEHLIDRLKFSKHIKDVCIATTTNPNDDVLEDFCRSKGIQYFRGSENDVLDRYYQAAKRLGAENVVRITSDCPLIDPKTTDEVIDAFLNGNYDFVSNINPPTYPDGLDTYVFSFNALERAWKESKDPYEREHVTPYFWKHPEIFKVRNISQTTDMSQTHRWTLDYPEDYAFIKKVYEELHKPDQAFSMQDVLELLQKKPEIVKINANRLQNNSFK